MIDTNERKFFTKKMRLLHKSDFDFVFKKPKFIQINGISIFSRKNQLKFPRLGFSISKKNIKWAHERNRIKRHTRETFRYSQCNLLTADFVLVVRSNKILYLENNNLIRTLKEIWYRHWR